MISTFAPPTSGNLETSVILLPNLKEEYVIKPTVWLGTVDVSIALEGGWNLTQLGTKADTKIPETIAALTGTLTATRGIPAGLPAPGAIPTPSVRLLEPGLYRINFDDEKGIAKSITMVPLM